MYSSGLCACAIEPGRARRSGCRCGEHARLGGEADGAGAQVLRAGQLLRPLHHGASARCRRRAGPGPSRCGCRLGATCASPAAAPARSRGSAASSHRARWPGCCASRRRTRSRAHQLVAMPPWMSGLQRRVRHLEARVLRLLARHFRRSERMKPMTSARNSIAFTAVGVSDECASRPRTRSRSRACPCARRSPACRSLADDAAGRLDAALGQIGHQAAHAEEGVSSSKSATGAPAPRGRGEKARAQESAMAGEGPHVAVRDRGCRLSRCVRGTDRWPVLAVHGHDVGVAR